MNHDIEAIIFFDMIVPKRPGTGISPLYHDLVVGRTARIDIKENDILQWDMI
jgi:sialic acid synthase SpsE